MINGIFFKNPVQYEIPSDIFFFNSLFQIFSKAFQNKRTEPIF